MNNNYETFEKAVFEWLMKWHDQDRNLCFSTRQNAIKGTERDYFIGTKKSNYFATTLWWIPVSFPGSSSDLINIIFSPKGEKYTAKLQFLQTRAPENTQNELALSFIRKVKEDLVGHGINVYQNPPSHKMEYFDINLCEVTDLTVFLKQLKSQLDLIIPIVDDQLSRFKEEHIMFNASRIDINQFDNVFQRKLHERLAKHGPTKPPPPSPEPTITKSQIPFDNPLNTILYGPPGTGKTYITVERALQIVDPQYYHENAEDRESLNSRFAELSFKDFDKESNAQIAFCTFHQSMSYEDFIEGIKPKTENNKVIYEVQDGIFKYIAQEARNNYLGSLSPDKFKEDFDVALRKLKDDWEREKNMKFKMKMKGYEFTILEFTNYSIKFKNANGGTSHSLSLTTLQEAYYGTKEVRKTGVGIYYPGVLEKLNNYSKGLQEKTELKNYVIIIDEINRGNISQIFGELITCIEKSKRLGNKEEEIEVILPYSKTAFNVPPNLYILGTMNTADRSVEALDTALRRRFHFEEMLPHPEKIQEIFEEKFLSKCIEKQQLDWEDLEWKKIEAEYIELLPSSQYEAFKWKDIETNVVEMSSQEFKEFWDTCDIEILTVSLLRTINERIEMLLNRDNLIGHSYFINVYTWDALRETIFKNIIPLLQEYFFGDYAKIGLILGKGFVRVKYDERRRSVRFADFPYEDLDTLQRTIYELIPPQEVIIKVAINLLLNKTVEKTNGQLEEVHSF